MRLFVYFLILLCVALTSGCPRPETAPPDVRVQIGDLTNRDLYANGEKRRLSYMRGDLINCRNISIDYLEGDIRGEKTRGVVVNVMRGSIDGGGVTVNVLHGSIVRGENVTVNLLIGEDLSGQARVARTIDPDAPAAAAR